MTLLFVSGLFWTLLFKAAEADGVLAKMLHSFLRAEKGKGRGPVTLLVPLSNRP